MSGICDLIRLDTGFGHVRKIWADATLYYGADLRRKLGLAKQVEIDDAGLILAAYEKWGEDCAEHLEGDFAFAIWDAREQKLYCARDRVGMRPFYYHFSSGKCFVFASDARDVFRYQEVPFAINEGRIADFIVQELEWIDYTSTFFKGIYRLPPAHKIVVSRTGMHLSEYWTPEPGPETGFGTNEEYQEALLDIFTRAVDERLGAPEGKVGSMLSGGMDSGSIVAVANRLLTSRGQGPIRTYSLAQARGADCTDSQRIYATLDYLGIEGTQICADDTGDLDEDVLADLEEPFDGQMLFARAIYLTAQRQGIGTVLDGAAGDVVFNEGRHVARLIRKAKLGQAWCEISGERVFWEESSLLPALARHVRAGLVPEIAKRPFRAVRHRVNARACVKSSLIRREFADRIDIDSRFDRLRETFSGITSRDPSLELTRKLRPNLTAGRERYGRMAKATATEARDPFTDQRVIDLCTRLPGNQLLRNGWPKYVLREAMQGYLPDEVRWGPGKPHIGWLFNQAFLRREKSRGTLQLERLKRTLAPYVDSTALCRTWDSFEAGGTAEPIHTAYILSAWLGQIETRPVVKDQVFS